MVVTLLIFGRLVKAPTVEGRKLMDEVEGLKLYLSVAERDELARMKGPDAPPALDEKRYEMLLPYAVALEVEDAWTEQVHRGRRCGCCRRSHTQDRLVSRRRRQRSRQSQPRSRQQPDFADRIVRDAARQLVGVGRRRIFRRGRWWWRRRRAVGAGRENRAKLSGAAWSSQERAQIPQRACCTAEFRPVFSPGTYAGVGAAICTQLRPQRLAAYTASSARAIRCSPQTPSMSLVAMPMLHVRWIGAPKPGTLISATR